MYANGQDAQTPQLATGASLGEGYVADAVYLSTDGGKTWERVSGGDGADGDSFFQEVSPGSDTVTFTLADGTTFTVPYVKDFLFAFEQTALTVAVGGLHLADF